MIQILKSFSGKEFPSSQDDAKTFGYFIFYNYIKYDLTIFIDHQ